MKKITILVLACLPFLIYSCGTAIKGSGFVISENRAVSSFSSIVSSNSIDVELINSTEQKVVVSADDNLIQKVKTEVSAGGVLQVKYASNTNIMNAHVVVKVYTPKFVALSASSSSSITSKAIFSGLSNVTIEASSSADIDVKIEANSVLADASSSGSVKIEGNATTLEANGESSGSIEASKLIATDVKANASSSGDVEVCYTSSLYAAASSSGSIKYKGSGTNVKVKESSSGSVSRMGN